MEEKKVFFTLVNKEHKLSDNSFARGKILGWAELMCDLYGGYEEKLRPDGEIHIVHTYRGGWITTESKSLHCLKTKCTAEQYEKFAEYVEERYPGLCTFYWDRNK